MDWHLFTLVCSKCDRVIDSVEMFVNSDGYICLESYCFACKADVIGEPEHIYSIMQKCENIDKGEKV